MPALALWMAAAFAQLLPLEEQRPIEPRERLARFNFAAGDDGFTPAHACTLSASDGVLHVSAFADDPYLHSPSLHDVVVAPGSVVARLVARARGGGTGRWYWTTREQPRWCEEQSAGFALAGDGEWREVQTFLPVTGTMLQLRLDPLDGAGSCDVEEIEVWRAIRSPWVVHSMERNGDQLRFDLGNEGDAPLTVHVGEARVTIPPLDHRPLPVDVTSMLRVANQRHALLPIRLDCDGFAPRFASPCWDQEPRRMGSVTSEWRLHCGDLVVELAEDGSGAWIHTERDAADGNPTTVALIAPLLARVGSANGPPLLPFEAASDGAAARARVTVRDATHATWSARGAVVELTLHEGELFLDVSTEFEVEGPVVRTTSPGRRALFCGLELLGTGESSSSTLDVETDAHLRYAPDPSAVTWPLMAEERDPRNVAVTWDRRDLQPLFARPNLFDAVPGSRMALRGRGHYQVRVHLKPGALEDEIRWATELLLTPRPSTRDAPQPTRAAQSALCRAALAGPLRDSPDRGRGWGHCAEPSWPRAPYASFVSTLWRIDGVLPAIPAGGALADGGSHLTDDAAWFLTGQAQPWLEQRQQAADQLRAAQQTDGLWHDTGPFSRGHFETTAIGLCAPKALALLDHYRCTNSTKARDAGYRALLAMERFDLPRGAQTWELPLHAPDLLAAAYAVAAFVRGAELCGPSNPDDVARRREWIAQARRWAILGLPFVYLWGDRPIERYATIPAFAATNWTAPCWIGLPVQWCGVVYADALVKLAAHDATGPWRVIAKGILATGEAMQHPDGPLVGCLPDAFRLADQVRVPASINPCALYDLRLALEDAPVELAIARSEQHVIVGPYPIRIEGARAICAAPEAVRFQVVIDGARVREAVGATPIALDEERR